MIGQIIMAMILANAHDNKRINHALKVYGIAKCIASEENLSDEEMQTVEIAAVLHDIAIGYCEKTFGKCTGKMQEEHGPAIARQILEKTDVSERCIERVMYLIAHHHTYNNIDGIDYRIIVEADFLVNGDEGNISMSAFMAAYNKFFETSAAKALAKGMFEF